MELHGTVRTIRDQRGRAAVVAICIGGIVALALLGGLGWRVRQQLDTMQQRVEELDRRAAEAEQEAATERRRADDAEERARLADERLGDAEDASARAARERERALEAQRAAENEAEFARQETERALDDAAEARAEADRIRAERDAELNRLQGALGQIVETRRTALGVVMNLGEDAINFDFDRAELKVEDRELLSRIVGILLTSDGYRVQVFGHTDDVGTEEYNQVLSERRAAAVSSYLVEAGIDPAIITSKGLGETRPLLEGSDDVARARNRRVEIGIIDTVVDYAGTSRSRQR